LTHFCAGNFDYLRPAGFSAGGFSPQHAIVSLIPADALEHPEDWNLPELVRLVKHELDRTDLSESAKYIRIWLMGTSVFHPLHAFPRTQVNWPRPSVWMPWAETAACKCCRKFWAAGGMGT
jgi:hypothetical protein